MTQFPSALISMMVLVCSSPSLATLATSTRVVKSIATLELASGPRPLGPIALSADGSTAAVGGRMIGAGEVMIFDRPRGGWGGHVRPAAILTEPHSRPGDEFGSDVSLSRHGRLILVAAFNGVEGTQAFIFARPTGGWSSTDSTKAVLTSNTLGRAAQFGYSVSLSVNGSTALVGDPSADSFLYTEPKTGWKSTIRASATLSGGYQVDLDGSGSRAFVHFFEAGCGNTYGRGRRVAVPCDSLDMYLRPARGWRNSPAVSARLNPRPGIGQGTSSEFANSISVSNRGGTVEADDDGTAWIFTQVERNYHPHGVTMSVSSPGTAVLSGDGQTLLTDHGTQISVADVFLRPVGGWRQVRGPTETLAAPLGAHTLGKSRSPVLDAKGNIAMITGLERGRVMVYRV